MHSDTPPSHAASEHTRALIMAAMRDLPQQMQIPASGAVADGCRCRSLHGRKIGLYGYGRIGRRVAAYAKAFGMEVVWWGSEDGRSRALPAADGETVAMSREAFFGTCDIVGVHVRLKPGTPGIITAADFAAMGGDALFCQHVPRRG